MSATDYGPTMTEFVSITAGLALHPLDRDLAALVADGRRSGLQWYDDFPAEGAGVGQAVAVPWRQPWLVLADGRACGTVGFKAPPEDGVAEIGYGIVPAVQGRGVATAAVERLLQLGWDVGLSAVTAETAVENAASQCVLRKLNFVQNGVCAESPDGPLILWRRPRP